MLRPTLSPKLKNGVSVVLVGALGLLATGCSSSSSTTATVYPIRVWRYNQAKDPLNDVLSQFQTAHTNATVSYQNNTDLSTYETSTLASLASQTGPELWSIPNDWLGDEESRIQPLPADYFSTPGSKGYLTPVQQVSKLYPPHIAEALIDNNQAYGLATNADLLRLYFNPDVFSQSLNDFEQTLGDYPSDSQVRPVQELLSKPPATWSDLLRQIPYINRKSGNTFTRSAIALGTANNIPVAEDTLALLMYQNGVDITNSDRTRALFNTQQPTPSGAIVRPGENALDFYASFALPSRANYSWNPSMPDALDAFGQGKVAMVIDYSDFGKQLKIKYPQFQFSTAETPQINTTDPAVNLVTFSLDSVTKAASNTTLAMQLLYQTDTPDSASNLAQQAGLRSPLLKTLQSNTDDLTAKSIITARTVFKKNHVQFDQDFLQMITDVTQNGATVAGALDVGAQKINDLLTPPLPIPSASPTS